MQTHANGEINYTIKGVPVKIIVRWDYKAEAGGDSHHAVVKGAGARLISGRAKPKIISPFYILSLPRKDDEAGEAVQQATPAVATKYPSVTAEKLGKEWKVIIPASYDIGHEPILAG